MVKGKKKINWKKIKWGSLTRWLKRHEKEIKRLTGRSPFTRTGEINDNTLRYLKAHKDVLKKIAGKQYKHILRKIIFKLNVLRG